MKPKGLAWVLALPLILTACPATTPKPPPTPNPGASPTPTPAPDPTPDPNPTPGPTPLPGPAPTPNPSPAPGPTPNPPAGARTFGYLSVGKSSFAGYTYYAGYSAVFFQSAGAAPSPVLPGGLDTCVVGTGPAPADLAPVPSAPLDAGTPVSINQGDGAYATFERQSDNSYRNAANDAPPDPTGPLTANVPGASGGFPAFSGAAFPAIPDDLTVTPAPGGSVTPDTTFSWSRASNDASTVVSFVALQSAGSAQTYVFCTVADDGRFAFPAKTRTDLADKGWTSGTLDEVERTSSASYTESGATLVLMALNQQGAASVTPLSRQR